VSGTFSYLTSRRAEIGHHLDQANRWLTSASDDTHTVALSYAGFELRNEIELIATRYLRGILDRKFTHTDLSMLSSFKKMENEIYAADGNQRLINKKMAFMDMLFDEVGMPFKPIRINFGRLSDMWHRCSEYCHISWTFASSKDAKNLFPLALADQKEIFEYLKQFSQPNVAWPGILSPEFSKLREQFVAGEIDKEAVVAEFRRQGIWGSLETPGQETRIFKREGAADSADA
jgi:hypothetical protein